MGVSLHHRRGNGSSGEYERGKTMYTIPTDAKLIWTENGRTNNVGWREMYRLTDGRYISVVYDRANNDRIVQYKITKTKPRKWNVRGW